MSGISGQVRKGSDDDNHWTNDDGPPRRLVRVQDGDVAFYRNGTRYPAMWA